MDTLWSIIEDETPYISHGIPAVRDLVEDLNQIEENTMPDFSMQQFKDEMIPLVHEAIAANSQKEFIEFTSGSFRCRIRLDQLEKFLKKLGKLPATGVKDTPPIRTHKQTVNNFSQGHCAARLEKDNY